MHNSPDFIDKWFLLYLIHCGKNASLSLSLSLQMYDLSASMEKEQCYHVCLTVRSSSMHLVLYFSNFRICISQCSSDAKLKK
jgi:hypothetical protein